MMHIQFVPLTNQVRGPYCKLQTKSFSPLFIAQVQRALWPYASLEAIRIDNDDGDEDTKCTGHTSRGKKHGSVTYSTNQEEVSTGNLDIYY